MRVRARARVRVRVRVRVSHLAVEVADDDVGAILLDARLV